MYNFISLTIMLFFRKFNFKRTAKHALNEPMWMNTLLDAPLIIESVNLVQFQINL